MPRDPDSSPQTLAVLAALLAEPTAWRHGYDLARETSLKSGTLYPILRRLAERGLLETCWEDEQPQGRPRRHLYRLSEHGLARARKHASAGPGRRRPRRARPSTAERPA